MKGLTLLKVMYMFPGLNCFFESSTKLIMMSTLPTILHFSDKKFKVRIDVKYFVWIKIEFKRMKYLLFSNFASKKIVLMKKEILK